MVRTGSPPSVIRSLASYGALTVVFLYQRTSTTGPDVGSTTSWLTLAVWLRPSKPPNHA